MVASEHIPHVGDGLDDSGRLHVLHGGFVVQGAGEAVQCVPSCEPHFRRLPSAGEQPDGRVVDPVGEVVPEEGVDLQDELEEDAGCS